MLRKTGLIRRHKDTREKTSGVCAQCLLNNKCLVQLPCFWSLIATSWDKGIGVGLLLKNMSTVCPSEPTGSRTQTLVTQTGHRRWSHRQDTDAGHTDRTQTLVTQTGHRRWSHRQDTDAGHTDRTQDAGHTDRSRLDSAKKELN
ncbi:unnamed protein product [Pleuronectes platessa]|uniref:Uncharacterized protein n=1 Tax=Pleuronectes platessa TaxID=8262 RepID=A0A9N7YIA4_PLEPL|nr:unnamed protein product [Pleuronectes platessa]